MSAFEEMRSADLLVGPFEEWRVMVDGRVIPRLTGWREGDLTWLAVDGRFACSVPHAHAREVAYVLANALAVGAGYSHAGAESRDMPFAPRGHELEPPHDGGLKR